jgi:hypothetical protein
VAQYQEEGPGRVEANCQSGPTALLSGLMHCCMQPHSPPLKRAIGMQKWQVGEGVAEVQAKVENLPGEELKVAGAVKVQ